MKSPKLELTKDGSHTLVHPIYNALYHSSNGAIQESDVIYINNGLLYCIDLFQKKELSILEMGFGSGLNAFNTCLKAKDLDVSISYTGIEKYPIEEKLANQLNFVDLLENSQFKESFSMIHKAGWENPIRINSKFLIHKKGLDFLDFSDVNTFDLIYFDAFSPDDQPELWTESIFLKMYNALKDRGVLVTYSSKGIVKRALRSAGFKVKRLVGPPGKHHVLRALKNCD